ncbi:MAG: helix-turn-helix domain-containing protein [Gemmiger sp.]|nr:helix-turn-helix domain-containing protein [Gemmiger sp.]
MLNEGVGAIIRALRVERNLTQRQLAELLHVSDKAVSKWERGAGCPDISMIPAISDLLGVDAQSLINGTLAPNDFVGGNMKNTKYYVCPTCHNISLCTGNAEVSCCGKKLAAQTPQKAGEGERLAVELTEDDWFITSDHPMEKQHYISFIAFATGGSIAVYKQYPEWNLQQRIHRYGHGLLLWYCTRHGLFYQPL